MDLFAALEAARHAAITERMACLQRLIGPEQWWLAACRQAVSAARHDLLDLDAGGGLAWAADLIAEHLPVEAGMLVDRPRAIAAIAAALIWAEHDPHAAEGLIARAAAAWGNQAPIAYARSSAAAYGPADLGGTGAVVVRAVCAALPPELAAPFVDLAATLSGRPLAATATVRIPILLDHQSGGLVADLILEQIADMPVVAYPDPNLLAFCTFDAAFRRSVRLAEAQISDRQCEHSAIRWGLRIRHHPGRPAGPTLVFQGASAGLGFALGFQQLLDPTAAPLSRYWAVTGALADMGGTTASVGGYGAKFAAAAAARLHVLYPAADQAHVAELVQSAQITTRAVADVAQALAFLRGHERPPCPYRGLDQFREADAPIFFGRSNEVEAILARISADPPLLAVLGSSGSGKSSLLAAGVASTLAERHPDYLLRTLRPGEQPLIAMAAAGLPKTDDDPADAIAHLLAATQRRRLVLVLDQFEEVLILAAPDEQQRFLAKLDALLHHDRAVTVVLVMRHDFYSLLNRLSPNLMRYVAANQIVLPDSLDRAALHAMIVGPAHMSGATLEAGLAERMLADVLHVREAGAVGNGTILPVLEFTLTRLWEESDGLTLTHAAYDAIGGASGALVTWGTRTMRAIPPAQQRIADRLLLELVQPGDSHEHLPDSRRRRWMRDLRSSMDDHPDLLPIIRHLIAARLVVSDRYGEEATLELIHDALVRDWDYLRKLLEHNRRFLDWKRDCEDQYQRWRKQNQLPSRLMPADELGQAAYWRQERGHDLGDGLRTYLDRSAAHHRRQRIRSQVFGWSAIGLLCVMLLISSGAALLFRSNLRHAEANQLAQTARQNLVEAPDLAIEQAISAFKSDANPITEETLHLVAQSTSIRAILDAHQESIAALALSPDGRTLATAGSDRTIILWDMPQARLRSRLIGHRDRINALAFSPDGRILASAAGPSDRTIRLWDHHTATLSGILSGHTAAITALAFSPDGRMLASVSGSDPIALPGDGSVRLWDVATLAQAAYLELAESHLLHVGFTPNGTELLIVTPTEVGYWLPATDQARAVAALLRNPTAVDLSVDGKVLVAASADGRIQVQYLDDSQPAVLMQADAATVTALHLSADGQYLFSGHADGMIRKWERSGGRLLRSYPKHRDAVTALTVSADGRSLISGGRDRQVRVWAVEPGGEAHAVIDGQGAVYALAFSPDGRRLAMADGSGQVSIHHLDGLMQNYAAALTPATPERPSHNLQSMPATVFERTQVIPIGQSAVRALAFNPAGTILAIGDASGGIMLWDLSTERMIRRLEGQRGRIQALQFHPSRPILISIATDDTLWIWDQRADWSGRRIEAHAFDPVGLAISPDGDSLITASRDQTIRRWAINDGRGHSAPIRVNDVITALSVDRRGTMTVGLANDTIRRFDLNGVAQGTFDVRGQPLMLFTAADRSVVVISANEAVRYSDTQPMRYLHSESAIQAAAYSPDGRFLAVGAADGRVRLILTDARDLLDILESRRVVVAVPLPALGRLAAKTKRSCDAKMAFDGNRTACRRSGGL